MGIISKALQFLRIKFLNKTISYGPGRKTETTPRNSIKGDLKQGVNHADDKSVDKVIQRLQTVKLLLLLYIGRTQGMDIIFIVRG